MTIDERTLFPAGTVLVFDDVLLQNDQNGHRRPDEKSQIPQILQHLSQLACRDSNHYDLSFIIIVHDYNFGLSLGNSKLSSLVRQIKSSLTSFTVFRQSTQDQKKFLMSLCCGAQYSELKSIFNDIFKSVTYFGDFEQYSTRPVVPTCITFKFFNMHEPADKDEVENEKVKEKDKLQKRRLFYRVNETNLLYIGDQNEPSPLVPLSFVNIRDK